MSEPERDQRVWKSYVWHDMQCWFVSTIKRDYETCEGIIRGTETLVWQYNWETQERGKIVMQAGGVQDHQQICRCLIAEGVVPDENDPRTERFLTHL